MKEHLQGLRALQRVDDEMKGARRSLDELGEQLNELKVGLKLLSKDLARQEEAQSDTRELREEHEAALRATEEAKSRAKARLASVKNTQEYMAVQREMEHARKAAASKEEEIIKILDVEEQGRKALAERRERLAELRQATERFEASYEAQAAEADARVASLEGRRKEILAKLPRSLASRYNRIRDARDGMALARTVDEICQACHMGIPPQLYNIVQRGQKIELCPHCNRILYYVGPEEEPEEDAQAQA